MNLNFALAVLAGISIGAAGTVVIHVQQTKTPPPAYLIAEVEVTDGAAFQEYVDKVAETMAPFEGHYHYVVRTSTAQALEGEPPTRIASNAFPLASTSCFAVAQMCEISSKHCRNCKVSGCPFSDAL